MDEDSEATSRGSDEITPGHQLNLAISAIGTGPYQIVVLVLAGGVYFAEGALLLTLSIVLKAVVARWRLNVLAAGAMAGVVFCGILLGTVIGGFFCDRSGRRAPILITYAGLALFLSVAFLSPDLVMLLGAKFLLGVSLGFGVPAANAMVCESCPSSHRAIVYCMTMILFSLGQLYGGMVLWVLSPEIDHVTLHWRAMLACAALPPLLLFMFAYVWLLESPHWLLAHNHGSSAKDVVWRMALHKSNFVDEKEFESLTSMLASPPASPREYIPSWKTMTTNGVPWWSASLQVAKASCMTQLHNLKHIVRSDMARIEKLFSPEFRGTTVLMSYIGFVSNFAYYGMVYGLPHTLKMATEATQAASGKANFSPAFGVFVSAIFEIPGVLIAIMLGLAVGRKLNMSLSFGGTALSLLGVVYVLFGHTLEDAGLVAVFCVKLFIASVFIVVYLYLLECYPTTIRATGLAFCMVVGRMGAFFCPLLYDGLILLQLYHGWFFVVMLLLVAVASILSLMLPYETKDRQLMADAPPIEPTLDVPLAPGARRFSESLQLGAYYDSVTPRASAHSITP